MITEGGLRSLSAAARLTEELNLLKNINYSQQDMETVLSPYFALNFRAK
jgi:hypothetical protein